LHEEHDAHVSMVRSLGEQVCYNFVCFVYQVVYNLSTIEVAHVRQSFTKVDLWILAKQLLVFAVTVNYRGWWLDHAVYMVYQFKDESSLATTSRTDYHSRKRMFKRQTHNAN